MVYYDAKKLVLPEYNFPARSELLSIIIDTYM